jgi:hypothetical protein
MNIYRCLLLAMCLLFTSIGFAQKQDRSSPAQTFEKAPSVQAKTTEMEEELPYREIPEAPAEYTACNVVARMVDGLGFRYYWATEGLRPEDLAYKASETGRTSAETIDHLYGLVRVIHNAVARIPNIRPAVVEDLDFDGKRRNTLLLIHETSQLLRNSSDKEMAEMELVFVREDNRSVSPFWNNLNGPIADALWHTGQIVMLRRASGNPFNSKVSVFSGTVRE